MSSQRRRALLALGVLVPLSFFAAVPWLKHQPDALVFLIGGIASALTIAVSLALSILEDRQLDEWHRSAARFSAQWGWTAGASLVALAIALPPFRDLVWYVASSGLRTWVHAPPPDRALTLLTFVFGFMVTFITQVVCRVLLRIGWAFWKSRAAREA